jgi:hypothetical protein
VARAQVAAVDQLGALGEEVPVEIAEQGTAGAGPFHEKGGLWQVLARLSLRRSEQRGFGQVEASGRLASHVAYWDAVAALNTPADMNGFWTPFDQDGQQLSDDEATSRRDGFLRAALDNIEPAAP